MLVLNPESVKFGSLTWTDVEAVAIDRAAARVAEEWSDAGPHIVFADVPERRVTIRVTRRLLRDTTFSPACGDLAEVVAVCSPTAADGLRARVRATGVVVGVSHQIARRGGATQVIDLVCVSSDGNTDPIVIEDASDGTF